MVDVRLPDGRIASFPDDMPREEIKSFIGWKFPDAGIQVDNSALLMALIRNQNAKAPERAQPQTTNNPMASSLPGFLGDFQNTSSAFQQGAIEGMTANFSNEIQAAALAPFDAIGRSLTQGAPFDVGQSYNDIYTAGNERAQQAQALNPAAAGTGNVTGALVLGQRLGGLSPMGRVSNPWAMGTLGAIEGGLYGGLYGFGGEEGDAGSRFAAAARDAGPGALIGGGLGFGVGALSQPISQEAQRIARGLEADRIDPASIPARIAAIDPHAAVIGDLGPNLQAQTAAIATLPGQGSQTVSQALLARRQGANERIRTGVDEALGPSSSIPRLTTALDAERQAINTQYEPVFLQKALSSDPTVDISNVLSSLDTQIKTTTGETRAALEAARKTLLDANGNLITDPRLIMSARRDLDGVIGAQTNRTIQGQLGDLRKRLDSTLGPQVPGLKDIDAQFSENARQLESLEQGRTILDTGRNAIDPADLIAQMKGASVGQNLQLSQGARAEINRIIGTKANDRVALQGIVRGDGSWNEQKLRTVFGDEAANRLMSIIDGEATMAATESLATAGSRTQVVKAAQDEYAPKADPSVVREALNFQYGNAGARVADALLGGAVARSREAMVDRAAQALMAQGLSPQMQAQISRIRGGLPQNAMFGPNGEFLIGRDAIAAALVAGASQ